MSGEAELALPGGWVGVPCAPAVASGEMASKACEQSEKVGDVAELCLALEVGESRRGGPRGEGGSTGIPVAGLWGSEKSAWTVGVADRVVGVCGIPLVGTGSHNDVTSL